MSRWGSRVATSLALALSTLATTSTRRAPPAPEPVPFYIDVTQPIPIRFVFEDRISEEARRNFAAGALEDAPRHEPTHSFIAASYNTMSDTLPDVAAEAGKRVRPDSERHPNSMNIYVRASVFRARGSRELTAEEHGPSTTVSDVAAMVSYTTKDRPSNIIVASAESRYTRQEQRNRGANQTNHEVGHLFVGHTYGEGCMERRPDLKGPVCRYSPATLAERERYIQDPLHFVKQLGMDYDSLAAVSERRAIQHIDRANELYWSGDIEEALEQTTLAERKTQHLSVLREIHVTRAYLERVQQERIAERVLEQLLPQPYTPPPAPRRDPWLDNLRHFPTGQRH